MRIFADSTLSTIVVPRRFRLRLWLIREARWLVPGAAVLHLPLGGQAETLLRPLMGLHLGHDWLPLSFLWRQ